MDKNITSFQGEYRFLSNFWEAPIYHDGIEYPTTEHAYQAAKTLDFQDRWAIAQLSTPGKAKREGRKVTLRPDFERVKLRLMLELNTLKFGTYPQLRASLVGTAPAELIEGNPWGDTYWGVCNGTGENHLGKILMEIRRRLS